MPYPKTVAEVSNAKAKLESRILNLVKEFEFETNTSVDQILCWGPADRLGTDRLKVRATINALADEVQIITAEVPA